MAEQKRRPREVPGRIPDAELYPHFSICAVN